MAVTRAIQVQLLFEFVEESKQLVLICKTLLGYGIFILGNRRNIKAEHSFKI